MNEFENELCIRYVKLHFTIQFLEDSILPKHKVSALRGGAGEMLLRANCIRERQCESCDFESECIVQRILYSKFEKKPEYVTTGDSIGYVLECENYNTNFEAGDTLEFQLILFGKTIVYFSQYLQAFYTLGTEGLGKEHAKYRIIGITNSKKQPIMQKNNIYMKNYQVQTISDYVNYRLEQIKQRGMENRLVFKTPLTLKFQNEFIQEFEMKAILNGIKRRIYMLDCFENISDETLYKKEIFIPKILEQKHWFVSVERYSSRKNKRMLLKGIEGNLIMDEVQPSALPLLLAGELIHIGKNTSFGFGRYQVW